MAAKNKKGFSLVEALLATALLGIVATGVILPFTSAAVVRAEGPKRTLAAKLACDLMEAVINTPFDQIVANYNYSESEGGIRDAGGVVFTDPGYARFSRSVSSNYVTISQETGAGQVKYILATVNVYYDGQQIAVINRLITR